MRLMQQPKMFLALVFSGLAAILWLINGWNYSFLDTINYLWLADRYAEGDWGQAVNTYWGPMISWLLLMFKPFVAAPFLRFRILQLILGLLTVFQIHALLERHIKKSGPALFFSLLFCIVIVSYAWFYLTPDLLLVLVSLVFVHQLLDHKHNFARNAIKFGLLGALMYFAKSAGLLFFIIIMGGKFLVERKDWNLQGLRFYAITFIFFSLFCSPWIFAISKKYGSFTIGTGSIHNYKLNAPSITPDLYGELGTPFNQGKLTEPIPSTSFDAWIEPAFQDYRSWEGMSDSAKKSYYPKVVLRNVKSARSMFFGLDPGTVFAIFFLFAFVISKKETVDFFRRFNPLFFLFVANLLVYLPFFFMYRYTWPGVIALSLLLVIICYRCTPLRNISSRAIAAAFLFILFSVTLYKEYVNVQQDEVTVKSIWETEGALNLNRTALICSQSDLRLGLAAGVTYLNGGSYYGALWYDKQSATQINSELNKCGIDYLICFDPEAEKFLLKNSENTPVFKSRGLTVFRRGAASF